MKAKEITAEMRKGWQSRGWFPVACRICDEVMLYPSENYKPEWFIGWECGCCKKEVGNEAAQA